MPAEYHQRKFHKCPFCDNERKRRIVNGRNKGCQRTCGSPECVRAAVNRPEALAKKVHFGPDNGVWIEDRSKVKSRPMPELTQWKKDVFETDDYTCQDCGQRGGRLQAHHILGYRQFPLLRWNPFNGITLCVDCHKKTDNYGYKGRENYNACRI